MLEKMYENKKDSLGMVVTIEEGSLKVIKKRFRGLNVEYLDVMTVASNLGYDVKGEMSEVAHFILTRELERLLLEKLLENQKDVIYIVPKYTPDIKKSVSEILKKNNIQVDLVVGLLMI
jgi:hypothetical protein